MLNHLLMASLYKANENHRASCQIQRGSSLERSQWGSWGVKGWGGWGSGREGIKSLGVFPE